MQTRERKEAVAPKTVRRERRPGGTGRPHFPRERRCQGHSKVPRGLRERRGLFFSKTEPFSLLGSISSRGAPPLAAVDWTNSFSDNLCQHPLGLIGSYAQFHRESHPTWSGGVFLSHTVPCCTHPAAAEVGEKVPVLRI